MIPNASLIISFASIALAATVTSTSIPLNVTSNFVDVNNSTLNSSSPVIPKQNETLPIGHGAASLGLAPPPLGPVLAVISRLTPKEQKEFQSIIENDAKLTKKQLKENLAEFVKGLPESVQKGVTEAKVDYELKMTEALAASRNLSAAAQELVSNIKAILDDDSITRSAQSSQLQSLHEEAKKEVLDELRNAGIPFPFGPLPRLVGSVIVN
ncbi:hypothetical protein AAVH_24877 [Aphelenchoides avenae]|nr:hypothetical protein AAVH_24877 [Aphelenchus avenae]